MFCFCNFFFFKRTGFDAYRRLDFNMAAARSLQSNIEIYLFELFRFSMANHNNNHSNNNSRRFEYRAVIIIIIIVAILVARYSTIISLIFPRLVLWVPNHSVDTRVSCLIVWNNIIVISCDNNIYITFAIRRLYLKICTDAVYKIIVQIKRERER